MMAKAMKTLELHYPMIQFLIIYYHLLDKSAYKPSGSTGQSLSQFQWHVATKSISTPPWMGC